MRPGCHVDARLSGDGRGQALQVGRAPGRRRQLHAEDARRRGGREGGDGGGGPAALGEPVARDAARLAAARPGPLAPADAAAGVRPPTGAGGARAPADEAGPGGRAAVVQLRAQVLLPLHCPLLRCRVPGRVPPVVRQVRRVGRRLRLPRLPRPARRRRPAAAHRASGRGESTFLSFHFVRSVRFTRFISLVPFHFVSFRSFRSFRSEFDPSRSGTRHPPGE